MERERHFLTRTETQHVCNKENIKAITQSVVVIFIHSLNWCFLESKVKNTKTERRKDVTN